MATGVGLHVADDACTAAIVTDEGEQQFIVRDPVLYMADDGDATLGGQPPQGPTHTITGFVAAVGDPAGISVDDGEAYRGEDLLATALFCLINLTAEHLSGPAEFHATHPANWPEQQVHALREALDYLGLGSVALLGEAELPEAAVHTDEPGKALSAGAASAALSAVLETPAGATPPDPAAAENSTIDTVVMPAVATPEPQAKAYSATMPAADPTPGPATTHERTTAPAAAPMPPPSEDPTMAGAKTPYAAPTDAAETTDSDSTKRTPLLIACAALLGLVLGGTGVALYVGADGSTPAQRAPRSEQQATSTASTTTAVPAPPPSSIPPLPPPPAAEPEPTEDPAVTVTTTTELPPSTPEPPPSPTESEAPTTTSEPQSTTSTATTSPSGTTLRIPLFPDLPSDPSLELPELGY